MMPKLVLALDTSTSTARVAVLDAESGARQAGREAISDRHSSNLLRLCVEVLSEARLPLAEVAAILCGAGPGSFTGLRVGLAVAKGLALPTGIPLVLVSSLHAMAIDLARAASPAAGEAPPLLVPCLDAGKGEVYVAAYEVGGPSGAEPVTDAFTLAPADLSRHLPTATGSLLVLGGPGAQRYRDLLTPVLGARARVLDVVGPTPEAVASLALPRFRRGDFDDLGAAVPLYGRPPDITRPKRREPL